MRIPSLLPLLALLAAPAMHAQTAILRLDSSPDNRCMKANQGGLWILQVPSQSTSDPASSVITVNVLRIDGTLNPPRTIAYSISIGQTIELECSQGSPEVSYQIVS